VLERAPAAEAPPDDPPAHILKYAVEIAVHTSPCRFLDLMEPLIERSIAEDIPESLAAIRQAAHARCEVVRYATATATVRWCDTQLQLHMRGPAGVLLI
jgi:hypothetical protein